MNSQPTTRRVFIFSPAFNVAAKVPLLLEELDDLNDMLKKRGLELHVLLIDDCSTDGTAEVLDPFAATHPFVTVRRHETNQGNSATVQEGYAWAVSHELAQDGDLVGACDADGTHTPPAFVRFVKELTDGSYDGICGSVIYPPHAAGWNDLNMIHFLGGLQAEIAGADNPFYVQSPGLQLHTTSPRLRRVVLEQLPAYRDWLKKRGIEFPLHGTPGVMIQLLGGQGAKLHSVYLACYGNAPDRPAEKLLVQAKAALLHAEMVPAFLAETV